MAQLKRACTERSGLPLSHVCNRRPSHRPRRPPVSQTPQASTAVQCCYLFSRGLPTNSAASCTMTSLSLSACSSVIVAWNLRGTPRTLSCDSVLVSRRIPASCCSGLAKVSASCGPVSRAFSSDRRRVRSASATSVSYSPVAHPTVSTRLALDLHLCLLS